MNYDAVNLMENMFDGVYVVDTNRKILYWNKGSEKITGYTAEEVVNSHCYRDILRHVNADGFSLCANGCPLTDTLKTGEIVQYDVFLHHKLGHRVPVTVKTMPVFDENGEVVAAIEVFTDTRFNESKYTENLELKKLVEFDALTQIYNRRYIDFVLKTSIEESQEFKTGFGILFIDIDDFKVVNDTYGHLIGDEVLKTITKTIKDNIQPSDLVGRWGGEEFVIILKKADLKSVQEIGELIRVLCENTVIPVEDKEISVTVSIGGAIYEKNDSIDSLVKRADNLMYQSKSKGKNTVSV